MFSLPEVSIIVPCFNEQATIRLLLQAILQQSYPEDRLEVVIADGMSTDSTRQEIAAFEAENPGIRVRVVDNPRRHIPAGLNQAIQAAQGEVVVRLDAHSVPQNDYVARSVADLQAGLGDNVGGVWEIRPGGPGWMARAIARAAAHPLAVGDARYRYTNQAQLVDTVPFGAFYRELLQRLPLPSGGAPGPYDETLLTNEDYEFNTRIRQSGGRIWLDPAIRSAYFARATLSGLARQYLRYGFWKQRMLRRYPETLRWRQALPPLFVLSLLALGITTLFFPPVGWLLLFEAAVYLLVLALLGAQQALHHKDLALLVGLPLAIAVMHFTWGGAFLWSILRR
jgi:succinoglycan biosynthesis protein ExoA